MQYICLNGFEHHAAMTSGHCAAPAAEALGKYLGWDVYRHILRPESRAVPMSRLDEIRLMAKVARMYYDQGIRQQEITERLNIHQSKVSRMLKRAREANIVRISVATPAGFFPDLEDALESRFQLKEAVVIDSDGDEERVVRDLGAAAAYYVETTIKPEMVIGISSWSRSLFSMVDTLHPSTAGAGGKVVQILGGVGNASTQYQAMLLAQRLAGLIGASPVLLQAPGVVGSPEAKAVLVRDAAVEGAAKLFSKLDLALVGIGSLEPSSASGKQWKYLFTRRAQAVASCRRSWRHLLPVH